MNYIEKYLVDGKTEQTKKRINDALKIWKWMRDEKIVDIQSGGLAKLIKLAEEKLEAIRQLENGYIPTDVKYKTKDEKGFQSLGEIYATT
jgi:hypothetical protein